MNKTAKGALAATTAGVLLLGGAGTLAYWTDDTTVGGGTFDSGSIALTDNAVCGDWLHEEDDTTVVHAVPGDKIYKECTVLLDLVGDHISATVAIDESTVQNVTIGDTTPSNPDPIPDNLVVTAESAPLEVTGEDTHEVAVTITVDWPLGGENNDSQLSTATLDQIGLVAVQTHPTTTTTTTP